MSIIKLICLCVFSHNYLLTLKNLISMILFFCWSFIFTDKNLICESSKYFLFDFPLLVVKRPTLPNILKSFNIPFNFTFIFNAYSEHVQNLLYYFLFWRLIFVFNCIIVLLSYITIAINHWKPFNKIKKKKINNFRNR